MRTNKEITWPLIALFLTLALMLVCSAILTFKMCGPNNELKEPALELETKMHKGALSYVD